MSYVTLEMFLKKKEQGLFWDLLKKSPPEDQVTELKTLLLEAALKHIDERAAFLWEALLHAVSDQMLAPLMKEVQEFRGPEIQVRHACAADQEATDIHQAHRQRRTALAQEIHAAIPAFREEMVRDEHRDGKRPVKRITLLETRKLLWQIVAGQWSNMRSDQEASALLDWLLSLETSFPEERDALLEIVRVHSDGMKEERLLASMLRIKQYWDHNRWLEEGGEKKFMRCPRVEDWLDKMLHAWIRRQDRMAVVRQLTALAPVTAHGPMAWDLLRQLAQPLGEFCLQARLLQEFINPPGGFNSIFEAATVVRYEKVGEAIVEVSANNEPYVHDQNSADVKLAGKIGEKLGEWMKHHPGIRIFARIGYSSTIPGRGFLHRMEFWVN